MRFQRRKFFVLKCGTFITGSKFSRDAVLCTVCLTKLVTEKVFALGLVVDP